MSAHARVAMLAVWGARRQSDSGRWSRAARYDLAGRIAEILSTLLLLADDDAIVDPTIARQL
jgi:hypothetical protein